MPAAKYDFTGEQAILKGATFSKTFSWKDSLNVPVSLVGRTARMHIRKSVNDAAIMVALTTENQGIVLGGTAGTIQLNLTALQTSAIVGRTGVYDLEIVAPDTSVIRLIEGSVEFVPEVTK